MIRTPDAKRQAEILMHEMVQLGLKLKRGQALDIIARLQGLKGYNELVALAPSVAPDVAPAGPCRFEIEAMPVTAEFEVIECGRLAAFLKHSTRDATTTLLNFTAPDGRHYRLQLSGQVRYEYVDGQGQQVTISSRGGLEAFDAAIALAPDQITAIDTPFFEWVDDKGDPVCEVYEEMSSLPGREIEVLLHILKQFKPKTHQRMPA